jgi:NAD(P)-dependent dehydrogenase (short-subunit alcohol dehydrogenase family)
MATRTWAFELARDGITVNAIVPRPIGTEMFAEHDTLYVCGGLSVGSAAIRASG